MRDFNFTGRYESIYVSMLYVVEGSMFCKCCFKCTWPLSFEYDREMHLMHRHGDCGFLQPGLFKQYIYLQRCMELWIFITHVWSGTASQYMVMRNIWLFFQVWSGNLCIPVLKTPRMFVMFVSCSSLDIIVMCLVSYPMFPMIAWSGRSHPSAGWILFWWWV